MVLLGCGRNLMEKLEQTKFLIFNFNPFVFFVGDSKFAVQHVKPLCQQYITTVLHDGIHAIRVAYMTVILHDGNYSIRGEYTAVILHHGNYAICFQYTSFHYGNSSSVIYCGKFSWS